MNPTPKLRPTPMYKAEAEHLQYHNPTVTFSGPYLLQRRVHVMTSALREDATRQGFNVEIETSHVVQASLYDGEQWEAWHILTVAKGHNEAERLTLEVDVDDPR